jgi:hypothetical protein
VLPGDIVQPYHKIIDLGFKLTGLWFGVVGGLGLVVVPQCYIDYSGGATTSFLCEYYVGQDIVYPAILTPDQVDRIFFMAWFENAGYLLIALFMSSILIVRHINETLPDHIYLRCFASEEEKAKRLPSTKSS